MVRKHISSFLHAIAGRFSRSAIPETTEEFNDAPPGVLNSLIEQTTRLSPPQPYQDTIQTALVQALQDWQTNPEFENNSLVVLGRPVEDIGPMLKASLHEQFPDWDIRFFLGGYHRPLDPLTVPEHLKRQLEPDDEVASEITTPVTQTDLDNHVPIIMVVSNLEQCFLRCIEGWEGIEYLQTLSTQDPSRFWVFGCNHWAWAFLERVCQISAYFEQVETLPRLSGAELQAWLAPLLEVDLATQSTAGPMIQIETADEGYWHHLASVSEGIASTAAQVWLKSLQIRAEALTDEGAIADDTPLIELSSTKPALPELMTLEAMDRYLLHSLLIHREMTRSHLAISLGEAERTIRSRLQVLRREGIVQQRGRRFTVDPAYYPKLYKELGNNNFLIGNA